MIHHILPRDLIIADRGFTIDENACMVLAKVKISPFTKGKKQLEKVEVDWSRELSSVRIHIESIIGTQTKIYDTTRDLTNYIYWKCG